MMNNFQIIFFFIPFYNVLKVKINYASCQKNNINFIIFFQFFAFVWLSFSSAGSDYIYNYLKKIFFKNPVEQIKKDTNQLEGFAEFEIDESFDPLIKVVFHIDNNHLVDFQRKFETSYSANLIPQKKYIFKVFYDSKNTNEVKLKNFISAYLEMIFKIESVKSIKLVDITEKLKYNQKNIHLTEKSGDSVEIFGVLEDVEKLVELINKIHIYK